ncbi:MAG TPA: DUF559 domain-containing protein [Candidatus Dormibacteraeota bacterium]
MIQPEEPFTFEQGRRAGLTKGRLRGAGWRRLGPRTYSSSAIPVDPLLLLKAARLRLPQGAAFSGHTAAWLHGLDVPPTRPIEVTVPHGAGVSARAGLAIRRSDLPNSDVVVRRQLPATSICRTLADLARALPPAEAVAIADMALHAGVLDRESLERFAAAGGRRTAALRRITPLVEPASQSRMESLLRMVLTRAGLPRPQAQAPIYDRAGKWVARVDLFYPDQRLVIEYDGRHHANSLAEDSRRQNLILGAGCTILRYTAADVLGNPGVIPAQVGACLRRHPAGRKRAS